MAKVPGGKPPEKTDNMLGPEFGIGSNGEPAAQQMGDPSPVTFASDHQLTGGGKPPKQMEASNPAPEAFGEGFIHPEDLKARRDRGET